MPRWSTWERWSGYACLGRTWILLLCIALAAGCGRTGLDTEDEALDQNLEVGRARKNAGDLSGAEDAFLRALQNNPRSAAAHWELGLLYYHHRLDWAGAIYHFERFLRLRPQSNRRDILQQLMFVCRQELAKGVQLGSISEQLQREIHSLTQSNKALHTELEQVRLQLQSAQQQLEQWTAMTGSSNPVPTPSLNYHPANPALRGPAVGQPAPGPEPLAGPANPAPAVRLHTVRGGETCASIARAYGVSLPALLAANPGIEPRRLRTGQKLRVPAGEQ